MSAGSVEMCVVGPVGEVNGLRGWSLRVSVHLRFRDLDLSRGQNSNLRINILPFTYLMFGCSSEESSSKLNCKWK